MITTNDDIDACSIRNSPPQDINSRITAILRQLDTLDNTAHKEVSVYLRKLQSLDTKYRIYVLLAMERIEECIAQPNFNAQQLKNLVAELNKCFETQIAKNT
jgi:hypothetical protein